MDVARGMEYIDKAAQQGLAQAQYFATRLEAFRTSERLGPTLWPRFELEKSS